MLWVGLIPPLWQQKRWAWAATLGVLGPSLAYHVARLAQVLAAMVLLDPSQPTPSFLQEVSRQMLPGQAIQHGGYSVVLVVLVVLLFQARAAFGVAHDEGWRTMIRKGGWAAAITGALYLLVLRPFPR